MKRRAAACPFEHLPVAATLTDAKGRVLKASREARRLSGRGRAGVGTLSCREYWRCLASRSSCPLKRALKTRHTVYHARILADGPGGERTLIERVSTFAARGGRRALIVTGPATAFFRRLRRLRRDASQDPLTAVCNRGRFDALTARAQRGERRGRVSAFVMMDVDGLKTVNDRWGHAAGDRLLQRLGAVLAANTRRGDVVGRVGGDEFAIYCPDSSPERASGLISRLRRALAESNWRAPREPRLSVSFGRACATGRDVRSLRARADADLYRRKRSRGRAGRSADAT